MICDFCSAPDPAWRYPATTFTDQFGSRSVEDCRGLHEGFWKAGRAAPRGGMRGRALSDASIAYSTISMVIRTASLPRNTKLCMTVGLSN
jgi:hypothetical protein